MKSVQPRLGQIRHHIPGGVEHVVAKGPGDDFVEAVGLQAVFPDNRIPQWCLVGHEFREVEWGLTSLLAFVWLQLDGTAASEIATLSRQIFWLVLPSLVLFLMLPVLLNRGLSFWPSLGFSMLATVAAYFLMLFVLKKFGMVMS